MPLFYRGAGPGTYWHVNDARLTGFTAQAPGMARGVNPLRLHIARGAVSSPYISLTRSYGMPGIMRSSAAGRLRWLLRRIQDTSMKSRLLHPRLRALSCSIPSRKSPKNCRTLSPPDLPINTTVARISFWG
jgi:hypothetical protein